MSQRFVLNLSETDWNAIRASLLFWLSAARSSNVHPSEHPDRAGLYVSDGHMAELAARTYPYLLGLVSADVIAEVRGWTPAVAKRWAAKQKIKPVRPFLDGGPWYDSEQVRRSLRDTTA